MALTFKQFSIDEDHIVTMGPLAGPTDVAYGMTMGNDWHDALNEQFATVFEAPILSPDIGYRRVQELLAAYHLQFPLFAYPLDSVDGEHIYGIQTDQHWFLYTAYFQLENGTYEFYAEILDANGLDELLSLDDEDDSIDT